MAEEGIATFRIHVDGRYLSANEAGLAMMGVTAEELTRFRIGDLSPDEDREALRANWRALASADANPEPVVTTATLVRPDGARLRIRMISPQRVDAETMVVHGEIVEDDEPEGPTFVPLAELLNRWRSAERKAARLPEGSAERAAADEEARALQVLYRFAQRAQGRD